MAGLKRREGGPYLLRFFRKGGADLRIKQYYYNFKYPLFISISLMIAKE